MTVRPSQKLTALQRDDEDDELAKRTPKNQNDDGGGDFDSLFESICHQIWESGETPDPACSEYIDINSKVKFSVFELGMKYGVRKLTSSSEVMTSPS